MKVIVSFFTALIVAIVLLFTASIADAKVSACLVQENGRYGKDTATVSCMKGVGQYYRVKLTCTSWRQPHFVWVYGPWVKDTAESMARCPSTHRLLYARVDRR